MSDLLKSIANVRKEYLKAKPGSQEQRTAFVEWNDLSLEEIRGATTVSEAQAAYIHTPFRGDALDAARDKWNQLSLSDAERADTIEEAEMVRMCAPKGSEAEHVALDKKHQLALGIVVNKLSGALTQ